MKIVVLAGGLSPERNVSLSSGTMITHALRSLGHQAALVDMYFGLEDYDGPLEAFFDRDVTDRWKQVDPKAPDLEAVKWQRKWKSPNQFGQGVVPDGRHRLSGLSRHLRRGRARAGGL